MRARVGQPAREAWFAASDLEVVAVAGQLWFWRCVFSAEIFYAGERGGAPFFFLRMHTAC